MKFKLSRYVSEFVSPKIIFCLDLLMSVAASVLVLFFYMMLLNNTPSRMFMIWWIIGALVFSIIPMLIFRSYSVIIRHATLRDIGSYLMIFALKDTLLGLFLTVTGFGGTLPVPQLIACLAFDMILSIFMIVCLRVLMMMVYESYVARHSGKRSVERVLLYGISDKSVASITRFQNSPHYKLVGFLTNNPQEQNMKISEFPVHYYDSNEKVRDIIKRHSIDAVLFSSEKDAQKEQNGLVSLCIQNGLKALIAPSVDEVVDGRVMNNRIREVKIEDLLGRPEIKISMDTIRDFFRDKVVMVTGAAGSIGSELCRQLADFGVKQLVLFDNAETPMHNLRLELETRFPRLDFVPVIGSVRHLSRLDYAFRTWHPQVVFHAAAYKHVPLMEENPCEAVFANVCGSRSVADKCLEYDVERMVMISTDKAVNPTNIMGCSKRLAEIYVQALGLAVEQGKVKGHTKFVTTRFGNVLGSNGSVIPRFREQIRRGGPITVTHPEITRFFMTIPEACRLVLEAATMSTGNQIYAFDMGESVKIADLAKRMVELAGLKLGEDIQIEYTGLRPGEKLYEEVLSNAENTEPTSHDRIRIAKVREYDYEEAAKVCNELTELSMRVNIPDMVMLMKKTVPEFKSRNSVYEVYDRMEGKQ
mgnify:CR=1 FL=1